MRSGRMANMKQNSALSAACATILMSLFLPGPGAAAENAFLLKNLNSGMYLSVTGALGRNGGNLIQWRDVGQPDAVWVFERQDEKGFKIRNAGNGRYLAVAGNGDVTLWADAGQPGLIWLGEKTGAADCYRFKNRKSGMYLAVDGGSKAKGANVVQRADAGRPGLVWCRETTGDPDSATAAVGTIRLRNDYSRMYLAVAGGAMRDGGNVIQSGDAGRPDIVWVLERQDNETFKIRNANSGKYLAVAGNSAERGGNVIQSSDDGQPGLIWEREKAETIRCYKFRNRNSGMYLAVAGGSMEQRANVVQSADVGHRLDLEWCRER